MSKRRKKEDKSKAVTEAPVSETLNSIVSEPTMTSEPVAVPVVTLSLRDAAQRYILGFKEHHWPAIRKYADSLGVGEDATVDQCLEVFQGFGARLK